MALGGSPSQTIESNGFLGPEVAKYRLQAGRLIDGWRLVVVGDFFSKLRKNP